MTTNEATRQIVHDMMERAMRLTAHDLLQTVGSMPTAGLSVDEYRLRVLDTLRAYQPSGSSKR